MSGGIEFSNELGTDALTGRSEMFSSVRREDSHPAAPERAKFLILTLSQPCSFEHLCNKLEIQSDILRPVADNGSLMKYFPLGSNAEDHHGVLLKISDADVADNTAEKFSARSRKHGDELIINSHSSFHLPPDFKLAVSLDLV